MKHIAIFENFTSFSDFQSIEKGQSVKYLGTSYDVVNNDGYILELKDEEGKIIKVNYNMFKDKGYLPKYESASEITFKFTSRMSQLAKSSSNLVELLCPTLHLYS